MTGPFKMKGSPMQRNFGIGTSPTKEVDWNARSEAANKKGSYATDEQKKSIADKAFNQKSAKTYLKTHPEKGEGSKVSQYASGEQTKATVAKQTKFPDSDATKKRRQERMNKKFSNYEVKSGSGDTDTILEYKEFRKANPEAYQTYKNRGRKAESPAKKGKYGYLQSSEQEGLQGDNIDKAKEILRS